MRSVFKYAPRRFVATMLTLITFEQLSHATATAMLALAGKNLQSPSQFIVFMIGFMVASQLPALIEIWVRRTEMIGYVDMYFSFLRQNLLAQAGRPAAWVQQAQRDRYLTAIGPEADTYLTAVTFSYFDIYMYVLNITLNAAAISLVIDADFAWIFAISAALAFAVYKLREKRLQSAVTIEQQNKQSFLAYIARAWDNVLIRNTSIHRRYERELSQHFESTRLSAGRSALASSTGVFLISLSAALPVFTLDLVLALTHATQTELLAPLLITLPRQLQILGMFKSLFQQITNLKTFSTRFQTLSEGTQLDELNLPTVIRIGELKLNEQTFRDLGEVRPYLQTLKKGRVTITGPNGAGKSSLLLMLNQELTRSFYLPASPNLEIGAPTHDKSTGQRMMAHLEYVEKESAEIILLDEWDANLDETNSQKISEQLDELSRTKLIIEVRH